MKAEILYMVEQMPEQLPAFCEEAGLIWLVEPEDFGAAQEQMKSLRCNCLLIGSKQTFGEIFNEIAVLLINIREQMSVFKTAVYTQQSLQMLTEMIFDILGNPAYIVDSSFKVLAIDNKHDVRELSASWKRLEDEGYLPFDMVSKLINSGELSQMESANGASIVHSHWFYVPFINYNLRQRGKVRGHIYIAGIKRRIRESDLEIAEYLGNYIQEALIRNPVFQNQRGDYYEHFMRDMLSGKLTEKPHIQQQMHFLGIMPKDYHTICVLHTSLENNFFDERISGQLERCCGVKSVFYKDKIVGLFSHKKKPEKAELQKALKAVSEEFHCEIGVSDTFQGFYDFNTYYIQAEWALTAPTRLRMQSRVGEEIRYYQDYQRYHILYGFERQMKWQAAVPPELRILQQYDLENKANLTETLFMYLRCERSMQETAQHLYIHRNTLLYRMNKIVEICEFDLENRTLRRRLLSALELMELFDNGFKKAFKTYFQTEDA